MKNSQFDRTLRYTLENIVQFALCQIQESYFYVLKIVMRSLYLQPFGQCSWGWASQSDIVYYVQTSNPREEVYHFVLPTAHKISHKCLTRYRKQEVSNFFTNEDQNTVLSFRERHVRSLS